MVPLNTYVVPCAKSVSYLLLSLSDSQYPYNSQYPCWTTTKLQSLAPRNLPSPSSQNPWLIFGHDRDGNSLWHHASQLMDVIFKNYMITTTLRGSPTSVNKISHASGTVPAHSPMTMPSTRCKTGTANRFRNHTRHSNITSISLIPTVGLVLAHSKAKSTSDTLLKLTYLQATVLLSLLLLNEQVGIKLVNKVNYFFCWIDKACTKYFPVLLRTTKLAQSTSQYHFVLQSLHNVPFSTTSYYKACTKHFPVLLRTTKLASFVVWSSTERYVVQAL